MSSLPTPDLSRWGKIRDRIGWGLATLGLYIATPYYRAMIKGSIHVGLRTAADKAVRDEMEKRINRAR